MNLTGWILLRLLLSVLFHMSGGNLPSNEYITGSDKLILLLCYLYCKQRFFVSIMIGSLFH